MVSRRGAVGRLAKVVAPRSDTAPT
jgi:hypothetical protein